MIILKAYLTLNHIEDLSIEKDILFLFDNTLHEFSKVRTLDILKSPLKSPEAIRNRQEIFHGFKENAALLKNYSYSVLYLKESYHFLNYYDFEDLPQNSLKFWLTVPHKIKEELETGFVKIIVLFHRLNQVYFSRLNLGVFPTVYREELQKTISFLSAFNPDRYDRLIREYGFGDAQVLELLRQTVILRSREEVMPFWDHLFTFEAYWSINQGIDRHGFVFPELTQGSLDLKGFYHPLLKEPVKNDFCATNQVVLLNGANMSGKSTFLKAIGLSVYLGHLGLAIPADFGKIPFFENFSMAIHHKDDIINGYSHFMNEIQNLKQVVLKAQESNCLAIFDEIFSGTNEKEGFEICQKTIRGLTKFRTSLFFISTHLERLKDIHLEGVSVFHIECQLIDRQPTFTYRIKEGWSEIKIGQILFEKEGLSKLLKED